MTTAKHPRFDPKLFLAKIGDGRTIVSYQKRQTIFAQNGIADSIFYIQEGRVKVTVVSELGKEAVIAILGDGEFVGQGCLAGQSKRIATASTLEKCATIRIDKGAMLRLLHDEPACSEMFVAYLLQRTIRMEEDLIDQLFNSSEKRLARALLLMANCGNEGAPGKRIPKVSQETLAEMIGTTRARVSFFMNKFRKMGLISYNGTMIEVHSSLASVVLHDQPQIRDKTSANARNMAVSQRCETRARS
jgi:CRP-like cAMP-binding protein